MPTTTKGDLRTLIDTRALNVGKRVTLSTGKESTFYFDCKPVTLSSDGACLVGDAFLDVIDGLPEQPTAIGGLTHGADPIISAVVIRAAQRGRPLEGFYVRKEPKQHGTKQRIENAPPADTKVVIVDDVVTTGGSLLQAVDEARKAGCPVVAVIALVDRDEEDGAERIRHDVPRYIPLYTRHDFLRIDQQAETECQPTSSAQPSATVSV